VKNGDAERVLDIIIDMRFLHGMQTGDPDEIRNPATEVGDPRIDPGIRQENGLSGRQYLPVQGLCFTDPIAERSGIQQESVPGSFLHGRWMVSTERSLD